MGLTAKRAQRLLTVPLITAGASGFLNLSHVQKMKFATGDIGQ
jgi:hypothetical protein